MSHLPGNKHLSQVKQDARRRAPNSPAYLHAPKPPGILDNSQTPRPKKSYVCPLLAAEGFCQPPVIPAAASRDCLRHKPAEESKSSRIGDETRTKNCRYGRKGLGLPA